MMGETALYFGHVMHARFRPRQHKLRHCVFSLLLDLDEAVALGRTSKVFGFNRPALLSVWEKDHGDRRPGGLKAWVVSLLGEAGIALDSPKIQMLCYPRMFGFVFNPLTVYYCMDGSGRMGAILYEVSNTFGERRVYVLRASGTGAMFRHDCKKQLYVSPFVPMDCHYHFRIARPGARLLVRIDETDAEGALLTAVFSGQRRPFSERNLLAALLAYPLMTLKVVVGIHWEAFRLFLKGVPVIRHQPATSPMAVTIVGDGASAHHAAGDPQPQPVG